MRYYSQRERLWENTTMTSGKDRKGASWRDTLGVYGCLVTAVANIYQQEKGEKLTPRTLNAKLIQNNGYFWLAKNEQDNVIIDNKEVPVAEPNASFLYWDVLKKVLNCDVTHHLNKDFFNKILATKGNYIVRIQTRIGGHYINYIKPIASICLCFDTYDGCLKILGHNEITKIIEINL